MEVDKQNLPEETKEGPPERERVKKKKVWGRFLPKEDRHTLWKEANRFYYLLHSNTVSEVILVTFLLQKLQNHFSRTQHVACNEEKMEVTEVKVLHYEIFLSILETL